MCNKHSVSKDNSFINPTLLRRMAFLNSPFSNIVCRFYTFTYMQILCKMFL
ncbi:hypothetical protein MBAV_002890 [Candidatus Magnetobacterium bavaricum]|uniref:Uncharacterized protein n=1 Tax=Candidatus Magnetobacterium bavaricum TaxID=29290 RepID=A0A0F3GSU7_9BACT|nr:hypothetical protein MBAV_002890 [Candidatus Magnetobacterium bavaricum]